jgi:hypothetical protein
MKSKNEKSIPAFKKDCLFQIPVYWIHERNNFISINDSKIRRLRHVTASTSMKKYLIYILLCPKDKENRLCIFLMFFKKSSCWIIVFWKFWFYSFKLVSLYKFVMANEKKYLEKKWIIWMWKKIKRWERQRMYK